MEWNSKKILAPSILAGNHANLCEALKVAEDDGRKWVHLDIMDGHFVPNLSFGPQTVADLRKESGLFFDVHLMLDQPYLYLEPFIQAGSDLISIHLEPQYDHGQAIDVIKAAGIRAGLVINPATEMEGLLPFLASVDLILLMTVNPGFGGQSFMEPVLRKASKLSEIRESEGLNFLLEVDGGVGPGQVDACLDAGVDVFVAGTAYFREDEDGRRKFAEKVGEN